MKRFMTKKFATIGIVTGLVLGGAGAAIAFVTLTGSGSGNGTTTARNDDASDNHVVRPHCKQSPRSFRAALPS